MDTDYEIIKESEIPSFIELTIDYFKTIDYNFIYQEFTEFIKGAPEIINTINSINRY